MDLLSSTIFNLNTTRIVRSEKENDESRIDIRG